MYCEFQELSFMGLDKLSIMKLRFFFPEIWPEMFLLFQQSIYILSRGKTERIGASTLLWIDFSVSDPMLYRI